MRESKFLCVGLLPILGCSLALLALTLAFEWRDIEEKVKASTEKALSDQGINWASVETYNNGRSVVLTGQAPSKEAISKAERIANQAYGVFRATHNGEALAVIEKPETADTPEPSVATLTPPVEASPPKLLELVPANISIMANGANVEVSGQVSSQDQIDKVIAAVGLHFGADNITNKLTIDGNIEPLPALDFVSVLTSMGNNLTPITAELNNNTLSLIGTVADTQSRDTMAELAKKTFEGKIENLLIVQAPVKRDICESLVAELLANGKINFKTGNATISPKSHDLLDQITSTARRCPDARFQVAGHTDSSGNANFNIKLSEQRAMAVVDYLTAKGLGADRFDAIGYGSSRPISDNSTAEGRAANRRIEFKLSN